MTNVKKEGLTVASDFKVKTWRVDGSEYTMHKFGGLWRASLNGILVSSHPKLDGLKKDLRVWNRQYVHMTTK